MSILDLLKADHKEVSDLLSEMSETTERAAKKREQLFTECKTALMAHSHAELEAFYLPLLRDGDDEDALREAQVEHEVVERLLEDISSTASTDEKWLAKVTVLKELIEHHVEDEEGEIFKLAKKAYDKKQLDEIGTRFEQLKQQKLAQTPA